MKNEWSLADKGYEVFYTKVFHKKVKQGELDSIVSNESMHNTKVKDDAKAFNSQPKTKVEKQKLTYMQI